MVDWSWRGERLLTASSVVLRGGIEMKAWTVIGLLFTAAIIATIPISPQVTPRGVELSVHHAQAITDGRYRRIYRRSYLRGYYGYYGAPGYYYRSSQPIGGGGGQRYPW